MKNLIESTVSTLKVWGRNSLEWLKQDISVTIVDNVVSVIRVWGRNALEWVKSLTFSEVFKWTAVTTGVVTIAAFTAVDLSAAYLMSVGYSAIAVAIITGSIPSIFAVGILILELMFVAIITGTILYYLSKGLFVAGVATLSSIKKLNNYKEEPQVANPAKFQVCPDELKEDLTIISRIGIGHQENFYQEGVCSIKCLYDISPAEFDRIKTKYNIKINIETARQEAKKILDTAQEIDNKKALLNAKEQFSVNTTISGIKNQFREFKEMVIPVRSLASAAYVTR